MLSAAGIEQSEIPAKSKHPYPHRDSCHGDPFSTWRSTSWAPADPWLKIRSRTQRAFLQQSKFNIQQFPSSVPRW